ncbi:Diphthamide synthesis, DPH1/DPH2 [Lasallia pustulata]|uniref:2-(3-amino-3-carboxypropyl)histidine synthase subunit 2 n=1 Tax=Lasallia pustulata TaxID=136370 RepID=A0A1W5CXM6_9LECA|nr:Diphthamide synthesis, DPH1/DPH2 [Lasallia pustulata]
MLGPLAAPPVLSTPETHIFEDPTPVTGIPMPQRSDEEIYLTYEIKRTVTEIREGKWRRVALQFPDEMLPDAPRVYEALHRGFKEMRAGNGRIWEASNGAPVEISIYPAALQEERLFILADTSYGSCCVDEIAAEHVDADVVVHYGRACLSPTARLPVIHIFTFQPLGMDRLLHAFEEVYPDKEEKVILMADVTYSCHVPLVLEALVEHGYSNVYATHVVHNPSSPLPNRTVPDSVKEDTTLLMEWQLFHISDPSKSLLLTLSSRVSAIHIYLTSNTSSFTKPKALVAATGLSLRRRYALLTSLSTVSIFGILINTLSVKNYLHIVERVKAQISAAGKKSYTFVVGKVNAAKVANFSEVGGWVVIGCWESSLVESKDFWKPVITPFELELALTEDGKRVWTGEWKSDFQGILDDPSRPSTSGAEDNAPRQGSWHDGAADPESEPESAPPEFDLRTGRYVSHSRPMLDPKIQASGGTSSGHGIQITQSSLIKRSKGDLAIIGGEVSPGAEYLKSKRTWKGLGSDFIIAYDESGTAMGASIEEGRNGIARGYTSSEASSRR